MKKCYYFPTWEEQKCVLIDIDNDYIMVNKSGLSDFCNSIEYDIIKKSKSFERFFLETPSDPILQKLCELTGAKMYGDYIVLNDFIATLQAYQQKELKEYTLYTGAIIEIGVYDRYVGYQTSEARYKIVNNRHNFQYVEDYCLINSSDNGYKYLLNIFEEYSKFLRKEENKWGEAKKILKI